MTEIEINASKNRHCLTTHSTRFVFHARSDLRNSLVLSRSSSLSKSPPVAPSAVPSTAYRYMRAVCAHEYHVIGVIGGRVQRENGSPRKCGKPIFRGNERA